jgi:outer membrane autotransporter protein
MNCKGVFQVLQRVILKSMARVVRALIIGTIAVAFAVTGARDVAAFNTGCIDGNCPDVPADGIRYTSGVGTVNVGDGVSGVTTVNSGTIGIELSRTGVYGADAADATFQTILWDTDNNSSTPDVPVVTQDGTTPYLFDNNYIFDNGGDPQTFTLGTNTYTGIALAQFLNSTTSDAGAAISGSLTVNNNADGVGAPFITTNAEGIRAGSTGGGGGSGKCYTVLFWSWCNDGGRGGDAGSVVVNNNSSITVNGGSEGKHGVTAISQGGNGGNGGGWFGLLGSTPGGGGDGGNGDAVVVTLGPNSSITTHGAKSHGVFAQSRGGNGGSGGDASGAIALGSDGGNGGDAGNVTVVNEGSILTTGRNSHGIYAQSVGAGAGSGSSSGGIYAEGGNGGGESSGAMVTINNSGTITTQNSDSFGILAQSIGGGGGDGGGAGGLFTVGGRAGSGGGSDIVTVIDSGTVQTSGDRSTAIFAQSIGGGGGNGGDAVSVSQTISVAVGGAGGLGGDGHEVHVVTEGGDIDTGGDEAHGIHAQSVGGGGGNGGLAVSGTLPGSAPYNISVALGGNGGGGGDAGDIVSVQTSSETTIDTSGNGSYGIIAQSIGGGGGNGSTALAGSGGPGLSVAVSIGGKGGVAGDGKSVNIDNAATITTSGDLSAGIFTQSIGGGGGNGGFAGSLAVGGSSASVSLGGSGGSGGAAGQIGIVNSGTIATGGEGAAGIFAQSIGGGGGNGGSALAGSNGLASVSTTVGGAGGVGNYGSLVDILNTGLITTQGNNSAGVFAQSIGGGGGSGGDATSLALAGPVAVAVAVGGSGGTGGNGGNVIVENEGRIGAEGPNSDGVFAQSIGGSGGSGGSATTGTLVFPIEIEGVEIPAISANVSVGGRGAGGGEAGTVTVTNTGEIETAAFLSNGVFAQSVGGSGGKGGHATNISIAYDATFTGKVAVGGSGGQGGTGNTVTVDNAGLIHTQGDFSNGVFAQSVGGGGGTGGNATNVSLSLTPPPTAPEDFIPSPSANFDLAIGGNGGSGATGGDVEVENDGTILTEGNFAAGVMAQSVGGAGGIGGDARTIQVELTADPMDFLPLTALTSLDMTLVFGGTGGSGSNGGVVTVINESNVTTTGAFSHGIVAQSVGGGGGSGGSAMTFEFSNADIVPEIPVLDDISGLTTLEMTLQGSGGAGGDGGDVTLNSTGTISTSGDFAMGVVAQSVAGGGGLAGFFNPQGITNNEIVNSVFNTFVDTEAGLSFAGSVGGAGTAGDVIVNHTGNIQTLGDGAHGLFAQSAAGLGAAGDVDITLNGSINALGNYAYGIYAQSGGGSGNGCITVTINEDGTVMGGTGMGAGIYMDGGNNNTLTNRGSISALSGTAIVGGTGNETVFNYGTVTGSVSLGAGSNAFNNMVGGTFNAGATVNLESGTLSNAGMFSPGGSGIVLTTGLNGNLMQAGSGTYAVDLDFDSGIGDLLNVSGTAGLAGKASINILNPEWSTPGTQQVTFLSAAGGVIDSGLSLDFQPSAVITYELLYPNATDVMLRTSVDFSPPSAGLNANQTAIGNAVNAIQLAGGSASFAPFADALFRTPDYQSLASAYDQMSPDSYDIYTKITSVITQQYTQTLLKRIHSIRSPLRLAGSSPKHADRDQILLAYNGSDASIRRLMETGELTPEKATYGVWLDGFGKWGDQDETDGFNGYQYNVSGTTLGLDRTFGTRFLAGIGIGYAHTNISLDGAQGKGDINTIFGALYGSYFTRRMYVDAALSYGRQNYDNERNIVVGPLQNTASSDHSGDTFSAFVEGGYNVDIKNWIIQPFVSLHYTYLDEESYRESGAGGVSLRVGSRQTNSLVSGLGARITRVFRIKDSSLIPEISATWNYDFAVDDRIISASFAGAPGTSFSVRGQDVEPHGAIVGAGLTFISKGGLSASLKYNGEFRENYQAHGILGELRYEF